MILDIPNIKCTNDIYNASRLGCFALLCFVLCREWLAPSHFTLRVGTDKKICVFVLIWQGSITLQRRHSKWTVYIISVLFVLIWQGSITLQIEHRFIYTMTKNNLCMKSCPRCPWNSIYSDRQECKQEKAAHLSDGSTRGRATSTIRAARCDRSSMREQRKPQSAAAATVSYPKSWVTGSQSITLIRQRRPNLQPKLCWAHNWSVCGPAQKKTNSEME
jgi:hypothetical protein